MRWHKEATEKGTVYFAKIGDCHARVGYASMFAGKWEWRVVAGGGLQKGTSKTAAAAKRAAAKACKR